MIYDAFGAEQAPVPRIEAPRTQATFIAPAVPSATTAAPSHPYAVIQ
jgi:hypothetical protein